MDYLKIHELYHWGIKGQKWGIRRYQNPDGSEDYENAIYNFTTTMLKTYKQKYNQELTYVTF